MKMKEFITENLVTIIIITVAAVGAAILARFGCKNQARAIMLSLVAAAESKWGAKTGEIKYSAVVERLYEIFPAAKLFLGEKALSSLIEEALAKLKNNLWITQSGESK